MAFQPVANTCIAELIFDIYEQTVENTLYFENQGGGDFGAGHLGAIAESVAGWWYLNMRPLQASAVTLREVKTTSLHSETSPQSNYVDGRQGAVSSAGLPSNVTLCVSFRTAFRGRSFRGRNFFVGLAESQMQGNTVTSSVFTAIAQAYSTLQPYMNLAGTTVDWVVVSRETEGLVRPFGVTTPVTSVVIVDANSDSMRGRLTGRGD